jgi:hypothetical protein
LGVGEEMKDSVAGGEARSVGAPPANSREGQWGRTWERKEEISGGEERRGELLLLLLLLLGWFGLGPNREHAAAFSYWAGSCIGFLFRSGIM